MSYYKTGKRGRLYLYNKIHHLKRQNKPLLTENIPKEQEIVSYAPDLDAEFSLQCLRNVTITMDEFDPYWRKCTNYRLNQIKDMKTALDILTQWPEYKSTSVYHLVDMDFCIKFPKAKNIEVKWAQYAEKLFDLRVKTCNEESKIFGTFWLLHHLLPPSLTVLTDSSGSKQRKKFSVEDSQKSCAIIGKTQEEVNAKLNLLKI